MQNWWVVKNELYMYNWKNDTDWAFPPSALLWKHKFIGGFVCFFPLQTKIGLLHLGAWAICGLFKKSDTKKVPVHNPLLHCKDSYTLPQLRNDGNISSAPWPLKASPWAQWKTAVQLAKFHNNPRFFARAHILGLEREGFSEHRLLANPLLSILWSQCEWFLTVIASLKAL